MSEQTAPELLVQFRRQRHPPVRRISDNQTELFSLRRLF